MLIIVPLGGGVDDIRLASAPPSLLRATRFRLRQGYVGQDGGQAGDGSYGGENPLCPVSVAAVARPWFAREAGCRVKSSIDNDNILGIYVVSVD